ncbi:class I SAM-dependent methyltransferase [Candidatus Margulisiibacteriota bacterium]
MKKNIRKIFDFLITLLYFRDFVFLFFLLKRAGLTSYIENLFLYSCAKAGWGRGEICEIGSYKGTSTVSLAEGAMGRGDKVYAVDPQLNAPVKAAFQKNCKLLIDQRIIVPVFKTSIEAEMNLNIDIRLLYIDGSHRCEDVKKDIRIWKNKLIDGGIIVLHDYYDKKHPFYIDGVNRAITEELIESQEFRVVGVVDTIFVAIKGMQSGNEFISKFLKFNALREKIKRHANKVL